MSIMTILEAVLIGPLKIVFESIFAMANRALDNPGLSIVALSLVMNILVLPLYKRADAMQEASREIEEKLHDGVAHIKKTFTGDERMMILQEYYRQNHYKPTDALNGSVSLLLEVPFFMAAYQFLSGLQLLHGVSLGPISDLGAPDAMIVLGGITLNALPVIMTLVNVISSAIYLKGFPLKTKVQLYAMAGFFLVFLYDSPSGLVFYWTLNNVFSLGKTIFYKVKNPRKVLAVLGSLIGFAALLVALTVLKDGNLKMRLIMAAGGLALQLPMAYRLLGDKLPRKVVREQAAPNRKLFLAGGLFMTVLVGLLIPSNFIAASPQEYIDVMCFHNPLWYIVRTTCLAAGTFLVWLNVFYWLASPGGKVFFERIVWILCGVMLVNYMFFGTDMGVISANLVYENKFILSLQSKLLNLAVLAVLAMVMYLLSRKFSRKLAVILLTASIAMASMSAMNVAAIKTSVDKVSTRQQLLDDTKVFSLSKTGKNVVVIVLDRALGEVVPFIFNEKPELEQQFSGFTHYTNVLSFGEFTNWAMPAVYGGYEYTPVEMNRRDTEPMVDKHNEALKMMPVLFLENGYQVTVCDPPYANYQWIPDLSIFDEYPQILACNTEGSFDGDGGQQAARLRNIALRHRNFFCFSLMKTMPLVIQPTLYNVGRYNEADYLMYIFDGSGQVCDGISVSEGMSPYFLEGYYVLDNLATMTEIVDSDQNTALILCNNATHEPMLLQAPDYVPSARVDNTEYDAANTDRFIVDGRQLKIEDSDQMSHYHANMAVLLRLGEWFDYLKENGVYDNTRIILASDHGRGMHSVDELEIKDGKGNRVNAEWFYPMMLFKDFGSQTFTVSDEFMTNADVPTLATAGLIENPTNPFTGKAINNLEKYAHEQFVSLKMDSNISNQLENTYSAAPWASVKDSIWDVDSWTFYRDEETILKEHYIP